MTTEAQGRSRAADDARVRNTVEIDMSTLVQESRWERVTRALLLGALPLSMVILNAI
jgi:hypothetical protein